MINRGTYTNGQLTLLFLVWWAIWGFIQVFVLHRMGLNWQLSFTDSFISVVLLGLACLVTVIIYRFYQPGAWNNIYRIIFAIGITILYSQALKLLLWQLFSANEEYTGFLEKSMPVRFVVSLLMLSFVSVLNLVWSNLVEQNQQELKKQQAEQLAKEAELARLRQQLQPHFLFNSLNSISALAGSRPDEARKMIQQLSDFLRGTLKKDENQTVSLQEELDHLRLYLEIEKVRFGHRMNVEINCASESLSAHLPPLLLQPIVENAIKFGLYGTIDTITVTVLATYEQGTLVIEITNPFDEATQGTGKGTGFGLSSVQRRLFLLYSRNDLLTISKKDFIFTTRLKIPQVK